MHVLLLSEAAVVIKELVESEERESGKYLALGEGYMCIVMETNL